MKFQECIASQSTTFPTNYSRRRIVMALAGVLPAACATSSGGPTPSVLPIVRAPKLGQGWTYSVCNSYTGRVTDELVETVVSVGHEITISRSSVTSGALAPEVHSNWGQLLQDPHWGVAMRFAKPLPAWPYALVEHRQWELQDRYGLGSRDNDYSWDQLMQTQAWQRVVIGGYAYDALPFTNHVHYTNEESLFRLSSERFETVWFVPEIGRWWKRTFRGTYEVAGPGSRFHDDATTLKLTAWA